MTNESATSNPRRLGKWWHRETALEIGSEKDAPRIVCDVCPRQCRLKEGDRGFCFVRKVENEVLVLDTYGRSTGFCIDPIEKKPLNHFYPGTSVLSFGTAGCNLGCQFCQNWDISKSREVARLSSIADPETIARAAQELGCRSVAFTYNDPVVWAEYAIDTAIACHERGIATVAVTAGYMMPEARAAFYQHMDAANVDLKAFTEDFYRKITYSHLEPVLETLRYLKHETDVWFEITNLVIPRANDSESELTQMCDWILDSLGPDVPVHFSAFHPDFRMLDRHATPHETLIRAYEIARRTGLRYVYVGNVHDPNRSSTYCFHCGELLIERDWYQLGRYQLDGKLCRRCGTEQSGRFERQPGDWGRKRQPVNLDSFRLPNNVASNHRLSLPVLEPGLSTNHPTNQQTTQPKQTTTEDSMAISAPVKLKMLKFDELTIDQKQSIQKAAQLAVVSAVVGRPLTAEWLEVLGELGEQHVFGVFTTLSRGKQLRGCCGFQGRPTKLNEALFQSAQRTAKEDTRMTAISPTELPFLSLDVSLLAAPIPIEGPAEERASKIQVGKHGLRISRGNQAGLLLPSVPVEQNWDETTFLEGVCRKAGLHESAWKQPDTLLEMFEGEIIEGKIDAESLPSSMPIRFAPGDMPSLLRLKQVAANNVVAMSQRGTPSYVALDAMDGTVHGIVLTLRNANSDRPLANWIQTSMRPGIPLQSSLLELCKSAAEVLSKARFDKSINIQLELTVLYDPVHHGIVTHEDWKDGQVSENMEQCDMTGTHPAHRAVIALCGDRAAVAFDGQKSVSQLVTDAATEVRSRRNPIGIFSMGCTSTVTALTASNATVGIPVEDNRPAAVARSFYPTDLSERIAMIDGFRAKLGAPAKRKALGLMTPHAGLRFSGLTAVDVWSRVELPTSLLILGPKHTGMGCDWAVSPSRAWDIPGGKPWEADLELAKELAMGIEGLELDMGAHASEHGIEIQLPVLEGLLGDSIRPKITAAVFRGATWEEIERFSEQLAKILLAKQERPLLVISSDMNHYQPEAENRRRDELAMAALMTGDAKHLLETCRKNAISMCGVVPAAIVLQTLHAMGQRFVVEQVSYTTSASAGGDPSRVVGYAGALVLPA